MSQDVHRNDSQQLIDLLTRQRDVYKGLRTLSEKQRTLISGDRPDQLLGILGDRQNLVMELAQLNERMGPYRRNWSEAYDALRDDQRTLVSQLLHEINSLLRTILHTDHEDSNLLSARKQSVVKDIAGVSGGQQANQAYAQQAVAMPRAADVTG